VQDPSIVYQNVQASKQYSKHNHVDHRLNMEVDLQSLFGLDVTWCAQLYSLAETPQPPIPPHWDSNTRALLVRKDRRHICVTP